MFTVDIPGFKKITIQHVVLDFNGTLAIDGTLIEGVRQRLIDISKSMKLYVVTADTFGQADEQLTGLPLSLKILDGKDQGKAKRDFVKELGSNVVATIGNGRNDRLMLREACLGIAIIQQEGASMASLQSADLVVGNILDALDLLKNPKRLVAGLRD